MADGRPLIEIKQLKKYFKVKNGMLHALDGIDLTIDEGKTLGIVGESGCGKTTLGRLSLNLLPPTSGQVLYKGENIFDKSPREMKRLRREMNIIFQDPYSSLNPRMDVQTLIADPLCVNRIYKTEADVRRRVRELMDIVGLAERVAHSYPHELDGGRRQRIGVAKALALNPRFIVCDEPVSALDVCIQAQILNLLMDLQKEYKLTYMFITHDLSVVKHISDEIAVLYMGVCVERAPARELFANPLHPYTRALLKALPRARMESIGQDIEAIKGEVTNPINPAPGCRFAARCVHCCPDCTGSELPLVEVSPGHFVSCTQHKK